MRAILQHTLQHSNAEGTIGRASAALLPFVASEPNSFLESVEALGDAGVPQEARQAFQAAAHAVVAVATERGPLTVAMRSAFESKFYSFMENSRGLLHRK